MLELKNFIGNEYFAATSSQWIENVNPATGEVISKISRSTKADAAKAIAAAEKAFPQWSALEAQTRADLLRAIGNEIESRLEEFAKAESEDQGKSYKLAYEMDIKRSVKNFHFFASYFEQQVLESFQTSSSVLNFTQRRPLGVCTLITPWNLPLYILTWKLAPAIGAGNTVVCKPSEYTSHTAHLLTEVLKKHLPSGVVNIVYGYGHEVGEELVINPKVKAVSFTGGTVTGRKIKSMASDSLKKISLELGGKNPNIIFDDADIEKAVAGSVRSSFLNQGEICLCGSRILVQEKVYDQFTKRFSEEVKKLIVGDPSDLNTFMGPVVSRVHFEKVHKYLQIAKESGLKFLTGEDSFSFLEGKNSFDLNQKNIKGFFIKPTVILTDDPQCPLYTDEIFGPVVTVSKFKDEADAIKMSNDTNYGLSASIWTQDLARAHRVSSQIQTGTVWVNCWMVRDLRVPFGGVKDSGTGREGGRYSVDFFTETTNVCINFS